jgi:hypothetical protein
VSWTGIEFAPLVPWPLIMGLGGAALLYLGLAIRSQARGWSLRFLTFAVFVLTLLNPALVEEQREPLKDIGVVVLDETPSQQTGDRLLTLKNAFQSIAAQAAAFKDTLDLRVVRVRHDGISDAEDGTTIFTDLADTMRDIPKRRFAGAIVITDGQIHDVPKSLDELAGPVHTLLTGRPNEYDRRLVVIKAPSFGIVGKPLEMTLRIEDSNKKGGQVRLVIRRDGGEPQEISAPVGADFQAPFTLEHAGATMFELAIDAAPDELSIRNNNAIVSVNGVRDRLKVLLISGEPHAGERTWRNLLKSDPSVDLIHFTILRPPQKQDGTPINELSLISFPIRELFEVRIGDFDLVILDRYQLRGVLPSSYFGNIVDYIKDGGALLEAAGPAFADAFSIYHSPLGAVLPGEPTGDVQLKPFKPTITAVGRRHPVTSGLAADGPSKPEWGRWFRQIDVAAKRGHVVMAGLDDKPLLILDRVGKGRVAQLNSDHIWLWSRGFEGGGPQAELLRRLAHWLMKEPELEENNLSAKMRGGKLEIIRRNIDGANKSVTVQSPDGQTKTIELTRRRDGEWGVVLPVAQTGLYEVSDGEQAVMTASGSLNSLEFADIRATNQTMKPVSKATGGGLLWLSATGTATEPKLRRIPKGRTAHGRNWVGLIENGDYIVTGVDRISLLPAILVLLLVLGGTAAAWQREGD